MPELRAQSLVDLSVSKLLLVGTKQDLRESEGEVAYEEGEALAREVGAARYLECSAKQRIGLTEAFETAIRVVLGGPAAGGPAAKSLGGRVKSSFHRRVEALSKDSENALADPGSEMRRGLAVSKQGARPPGAVERPWRSLAFSYVNRFSRGLLYGRAGRLTALFGGFRPGQGGWRRRAG
jgi:hypothetical protein